MRIQAFAIVLLAAIPAPAQWIKYPTAGIPRTSAGKPDLSAPAPRTADGKPDFSGIWDVEHNRPCPPESCDMAIPQEFNDIGWSIRGGLPYQPWAADLMKKRATENGKDDPGTNCMPAGIIKMYTSPLFRKIIQAPGLLLMLTERDVTYRQIFTDGRPLPVDPQPTANGYSSGKWDGDTLVVESNGFRDGIWLDRNGSPLSEGARITERIRRPNYGKMEVEITVNDPKTYTKPWTIKLNQLLLADTELLDYWCLENEQDLKHLVGK
jgi:hypothetical protein